MRLRLSVLAVVLAIGSGAMAQNRADLPVGKALLGDWEIYFSGKRLLNVHRFQEDGKCSMVSPLETAELQYVVVEQDEAKRSIVLKITSVRTGQEHETALCFNPDKTEIQETMSFPSKLGDLPKVQTTWKFLSALSPQGEVAQGVPTNAPEQSLVVVTPDEGQAFAKVGGETNAVHHEAPGQPVPPVVVVCATTATPVKVAEPEIPAAPIAQEVPVVSVSVKAAVPAKVVEPEIPAAPIAQEVPVGAVSVTTAVSVKAVETEVPPAPIAQELPVAAVVVTAAAPAKVVEADVPAAPKTQEVQVVSVCVTAAVPVKVVETEVPPAPIAQEVPVVAVAVTTSAPVKMVEPEVPAAPKTQEVQVVSVCATTTAPVVEVVVATTNEHPAQHVDVKPGEIPAAVPVASRVVVRRVMTAPEPPDLTRDRVGFDFEAEVTAVLNGDVMLVRQADGGAIPVRLAHIEVPPAGPKGTLSAKALLDRVMGKRVRVRGVLIDSEGNWLAEVWQTNSCVNVEMVQDGWARYRKSYSEDEAFAEAETAARLSKLGIWADAVEQPKPLLTP